MSKFNSEENNGVLKIKKSYEKMVDENKELAKDLDYITKEELIEAIHILKRELNKLKQDGEEIKINFYYEKEKNDI